VPCYRPGGDVGRAPSHIIVIFCNCDTGKALRAVTIEYRARDIRLDKGERTKKQPLLKEL
jgi:hypothetical protein